ncbi:acetate--CoA ligase family protein [Candidatus Bathyarchaeota archaeon]|jgi:acetyl-CoA synthetase (ADP-forming)|nr:acetate--CoA ligase family protein [Candidatus Bathyarchaeota archaeon]
MTSQKVSQILANVTKEGRKSLLETEAKAVCSEYAIPVTKFELAKGVAEAARFAEKIGFPIVLKIVSPDIIHKSDVGGVVVNLKDAKSVEQAYAQIMKNVKTHCPKARIAGVLVQEMAPSSTEVIIGSIKDPQFGPAMMFGLGGIFVEVLKDVTFRIAPITEEEAREMISDVKAYPLLKGYRNTPPADIGALVKILVNTSRLVTEHQEIKELDLNPVMVYEKGAKTVDARIILE